MQILFVLSFSLSLEPLASASPSFSSSFAASSFPSLSPSLSSAVFLLLRRRTTPFRPNSHRSFHEVIHRHDIICYQRRFFRRLCRLVLLHLFLLRVLLHFFPRNIHVHVNFFSLSSLVSTIFLNFANLLDLGF